MREPMLDYRELFARLDLPARLRRLREREQSAPQSGAGPFVHGYLAVVPETPPGGSLQRQRLARPRRRKSVLRAFLLRHAQLGYRAGSAHRVLARANRSAQVHQRLRVGFDAARGQQALGEGPEPFLAFDGEAARDHAFHVAVEDRRALAEREGGDRPGGRAADARQLGDRLRCSREPARGNLHRRLAQVAAARVVAKAAPEPEHVVFRGSREAMHVGKAYEKALVVRDDSGDLRLLQHHLGEPDAIGIARALPGQAVAAVPALPGDQLLRETHRVRFSQTMLAFILRRLAQAVMVMLAVGLIAF